MQAGADVNEESVTFVGNNPTNPLLIAAKRRDVELIKLLIQRGADVEKYGEEALKISQDYQKGWPFFHKCPDTPLFNQKKENYLRIYAPEAKACEEILKNFLEKLQECKLEKINNRLIFNLLQEPDIL